MSINTTASFVIPAVSSSATVDVSSTSSTPVNSVVTVFDGTNAVVFQVAALMGGSQFSLTTVEILAGSAGNTMASGATVTFASAPLSSLPSLSSPAGSDLLYVVHDGASYQSTIDDVTAGGGGGGGGGTLASLTDVDTTTEANYYGLIYNPEEVIPSIVQVNPGSGDTASLVAAPAIGNLLIAEGQYDNTGSSPTPAGWTLLYTTVSGGNTEIAIFTKESAGSADQSVVLTDASATVMYEIANWATPSTPVGNPGSGGGYDNPTASISVPANSLVMALQAQNGGAVSAVGAGWTWDNPGVNSLIAQHISMPSAGTAQTEFTASSPNPTYGAIFYVPTSGASKNYQFAPPSVQAGSNNFDTFMESFTGVTSYYPCNETSGTTVTDTVGSNNGTYEHPSTIFLASVPLTYDNKPCPYIPNIAGTSPTSYISIPDSTTSATDFSIACVHEISYNQPNTLYAIFSTRDSSSNGFLWYLYQGGLQGTFAGSTGAGMGQTGFPTRALYGVSYTTTGGAAGILSFYVNGFLCFSINAPGGGYVKSSNGFIGFGWDVPNSYYGCGVFGKIAVAASTYWTQSDWTAIANAWRALP